MSPEGYFDFKSASEEEENLDYAHQEPCPHCKKLIARDATICYFCGQDVARKGKVFPVGWLAAGLIIILILSILLGAIG